MAFTVSFTDIQDSNAVGGNWRAPLVAPQNNVDSGNNVGWKFGKIVRDFFPFLNLPISLAASEVLSIPRLQFVSVQDCEATGETWIATTSTGNVDDGNNTGFDFTSNLTIN
jgi:hypothetical protein